MIDENSKTRLEKIVDHLLVLPWSGNKTERKPQFVGDWGRETQEFSFFKNNNVVAKMRIIFDYDTCLADAGIGGSRYIKILDESNAEIIVDYCLNRKQYELLLKTLWNKESGNQVPKLQFS